LQYSVIWDQETKKFSKVPERTWAEHIDPREIEKYTIVRGFDTESLYGFGINYVIEIKLKPISERNENRYWQTTCYLDGFTQTKVFYKPLYETKEKKLSPVPDLRKTIHWEPFVRFDEKGLAKVKFYNGDRYTRIRCILEGISLNGEPMHAECTYEVNLNL
jgi:hypothetical protein